MRREREREERKGGRCEGLGRGDKKMWREREREKQNT